MTISNASDTHKISSLSDSMITSLIENCEQAFPALWRLSKIEMETALSTADYKKMIGDPHDIQAYILADLSDNNCHILRLSTEPEYQKTGLATCLINRMVSDCGKMEIKGYSVNTNKKNSAAVNFYQSLNFVQLDRVYPVYYRYL
jgi:ribosomal protein S18 acetylase RimI-like enzyme